MAGISVKKDGQWKVPSSIYIRQNGQWVDKTGYVKVNGQWHNFTSKKFEQSSDFSFLPVWNSKQWHDHENNGNYLLYDEQYIYEVSSLSTAGVNGVADIVRQYTLDGKEVYMKRFPYASSKGMWSIRNGYLYGYTDDNPSRSNQTMKYTTTKVTSVYHKNDVTNSGSNWGIKMVSNDTHTMVIAWDDSFIFRNSDGLILRKGIITSAISDAMKIRKAMTITSSNLEYFGFVDHVGQLNVYEKGSSRQVNSSMIAVDWDCGKKDYWYGIQRSGGNKLIRTTAKTPNVDFTVDIDNYNYLKMTVDDSNNVFVLTETIDLYNPQNERFNIYKFDQNGNKLYTKLIPKTDVDVIYEMKWIANKVVMLYKRPFANTVYIRTYDLL